MATVRLSDVAREAKVSVSAVSKALTGSTEISAETKQRVREIANRMGYRPNTLAKALREGKSKMLGIVIPDYDNPYYARILQGVAERARENGFTLIVSCSYENASDELVSIRSLLSIPVMGILAVPVNLDNYRQVEIPLIFLSRFPYRSLTAPGSPKWRRENFSYVVNDDFEGQRKAAEALAERGVRDIFLLLDTDEQDNVSAFKTFARLDGYRQALRDYGITFDPGKVYFNAASPETCNHIVERICNTYQGNPLGICVVNDYCSFGAITAIAKCGLSIPEQVAVVGYDDNDLAQYLSPPLTTVHVSNKEFGILGTMHIIDMINGKFDSKQTISTVLVPYLKKRVSA